MTRRTGVLAALGALLSGCSATTLLDRLVPDDTYTVREGLAYGPLARQRLDVYLPLESTKRAQTAGVAPLVVFFYGGSWTRGERRDYRFMGEALAAHGAVVVIADYRLSPEVRYPAFVQDSALAVRWAVDNAANFGADAKQLYLMGHSAGAYNAAMLALDARWLAQVGLSPAALAGWVGLAGPYDFLPIENPDAQVAFEWPMTRADSQPLSHATAAAPRTLLMAAVKDDLVNPQRSTQGLGNKLQSLKVPVRVLMLERVSHVTIAAAIAKPLRWLAPVLPEVLSFIGLKSAAS